MLPLFELANVPLISFSNTAPDLSDQDVFKYFFRLIPDLQEMDSPIIAMFTLQDWVQAVLVHGTGVWGRGLTKLVIEGDYNDVKFPATIEIGSEDNITEVVSLLSSTTVYDVFVIHIPSDDRYKLWSAFDELDIIKSGYGFFGTEDIALTVDLEENSDELADLMEGTIGVRSRTPTSTKASDLENIITDNGEGNTTMTYYAYLSYDCVITAAYAIDYVVNELGYDLTDFGELDDNDRFGNITRYSTNGEQLKEALTDVQLAPDWTISGAIYLKGNTRVSEYELINMIDGELKLVAYYS